MRNSEWNSIVLSAEVSKWAGNESIIDVLIRPDMIPRVSRFLRERQIKYDVMIPDLQQAIDQENPLPSPEELEELQGRNGSFYSFHILISRS